jgi:hypothetical protein
MCILGYLNINLLFIHRIFNSSYDWPNDANVDYFNHLILFKFVFETFNQALLGTSSFLTNEIPMFRVNSSMELII